jgi:hypothetical protein
MEEKKESAFYSIAAIRDTLESIADATKASWSTAARRWLLPGDGPEYQIYDFTGTLQECYEVNDLRRALRWVEFNVAEGCKHRDRGIEVLNGTLREIDEIENKRPRNPFRWASESIDGAAVELTSELYEVVDYLDGLLDKIDAGGESMGGDKMKPTGKTVNIIRAIEAGKTNDQITELGLGSTPNVRVVRSRHEKGKYSL